MLVMHWARHNQTGSILANGIRPAFRHRRGGARVNPQGVYVFPFSANRTLRGNWRHNLKVWDLASGNYNGFVFRLEPGDFPLWAGSFILNRALPHLTVVPSPVDLAAKWGRFFSGEVADHPRRSADPPWRSFEIIIPRHIDARRILRVLRDREPRHRASCRPCCTAEPWASD